MKLFYDARFIRTDFHDGVSRYSTELANALAKLTKVTFIICDEEQLEKLPVGVDHIKIHAPTSILEPFTARILNRYEPDVVFSPLQTIVPGGRKFKFVVAMHDLIYYHHRQPPQNLNPFIRLGWRLFHLTYIPRRITLNKTDMVVTVSQTLAVEIEKTHLTTRPLIVVPNAPRDMSEFRADVDTSGTPKNLIYMGSFMGYKNVELLIKGMKWLPDRTLHLLSRITDERRAELESIRPRGVKLVFHNGVSDEEYVRLLSDKAILVLASLNEGYGLPVTEAQSLGVPTAISDLPIFHEVAGDGAVYFDPMDPKDFAEKITELDTKSRREELISEGMKHSQTFSWKKSAQVLLDAINTLV
jgi:glycosyltransferase involved in cell wall biosynthesis